MLGFPISQVIGFVLVVAMIVFSAWKIAKDLPRRDHRSERRAAEIRERAVRLARNRRISDPDVADCWGLFTEILQVGDNLEIGVDIPALLAGEYIGGNAWYIAWHDDEPWEIPAGQVRICVVQTQKHCNAEKWLEEVRGFYQEFLRYNAFPAKV